MNELYAVGVSLFIGLGIGAMFFGGLWWTVHKGLTSDHPAAWFLFSQVTRMTLALVGFYVAANGQWQRLLLCLVGFLIARVMVMRLVPIGESIHFRPVKETDYASEPR